MRIRGMVLVIAGLALGIGDPAEAAKSGKHKRIAAVHAKRHPVAGAAQSGPQFQGGVLRGPLYNGQDYLGDDPDPNIRSFLIRDKSRYGGPE